MSGYSRKGKKLASEQHSLRDIPTWFLRLVDINLRHQETGDFFIRVTRDLSLIGLRNVAARNLFKNPALAANDIQLCRGSAVLHTDTDLFGALLRTPIRERLDPKVLTASLVPREQGRFFASQLSNDVLALILSYCDVYDRLVWSRVSRRFNLLLSRPQVWRSINLKADHRVMSHLWARKYTYTGSNSHPLEKHFGGSTLYCDLSTEILTFVPAKCVQLRSFSCTTVLDSTTLATIGSFPTTLVKLHICCSDLGVVAHSLRNLRELRLSSITSFKFQSLQPLENLQDLCVSGTVSEQTIITELSNMPKICSNLKSLDTMGCGRSRWDKGMCLALAEFQSLTSLSVRMSAAAMYHVLREHRHLKSFVIPEQTNDFDIGVVSSIQVNLTELNGNGCCISPNGLAFLRSSMTSLKRLSLRSCNIGMLPESKPLEALLKNDFIAENVSTSESLLKLRSGTDDARRAKSRQGNNSRGEQVVIDPPHKPLCSAEQFAANLESLNLGYSGIVGYGGSLLRYCTNLVELSLEQSPWLRDENVLAICENCRYLKLFDLIYCPLITGASLHHMANLPWLQKLSFGPPEGSAALTCSQSVNSEDPLVVSLFDSLMELELANCTSELILAILESCHLLNTILIHDYCGGFRDVCLLACVNLKLLKSLRVLENAKVSTPALKYFEKVKAHGLSDVLILPSEVSIQSNSNAYPERYSYDEVKREFTPQRNK